jgi:LmbE family N-acetylglucosaminyl deacetylase
METALAPPVHDLSHRRRLAAPDLWKAALLPVARPRVVLAIGAHPDDIELGCAGALARYRAEGLATHGLIVTHGERGLDGRGNHLTAGARTGEATRAAAVLGLQTLQVLEHPDGRLPEHEMAIRNDLESVIRRLQPDIVLTHNRHDPHADHRIVAALSLEAARGVPNVLCYENPTTPPDFQPNLYVDVSGYLDTKVVALRCHDSQSGKPYIGEDLIRSMARVRGYQARVTFAEAFEAIRVRWS